MTNRTHPVPFGYLHDTILKGPSFMLTRIRGALILVRLLSPVLLALAVFIATSIAIGDIREATDDYSAEMAARVDAIELDFSAASEGLETIGAFVGKTRDAVAAQAEALRALTDRIEIPLPRIPVINFDIPDIDFRVPGVTQLKALGADLAEAGRAVGAEIAAVATLGEIPAELQAIASDSKTYAGEVWGTTLQWFRVLTILILVSLVVWILGRLGTYLAEFQMGWRMLRYGQESDAVPDLRRLVARVRKLEQAAGIR